MSILDGHDLDRIQRDAKRYSNMARVTISQKRFDALIELARRGLDAPFESVPVDEIVDPIRSSGSASAN